MMKARDDGNKKENRKQVCDKLRKKIQQAENQPSQHLTRGYNKFLQNQSRWKIIIIFFLILKYP